MKKLFNYLKLLIIMTIAVLAFSLTGVKANAAVSSSVKGKYTFLTYDGNAYNSYMTFDFQTANNVAYTQEDAEDAISDCNDEWDAANEDGDPYGSMQEAWEYIMGRRPWKNTDLASSGDTYAEVKAMVDAIPTLPQEKTSFVPGEKIAVKAFLEIEGDSNAYIAMASVYIDLSNIYGGDFTAFQSTEVDEGDALNTQLKNNCYAFTGVNFGSATSKYNKSKVELGSFVFTLSSSISGTYPIQALDYTQNNSSQTVYVATTGTIASNTTYNYISDGNAYQRFNIVPTNISVEGASSSTDLTGLEVNGNTVSTSNMGQTTIDSTNYDTIDATGSTVPNGTFNINATVDRSGTVLDVKYGTTASGALNGTSASSNGNGFGLDLSNTTNFPTDSDVWAAITVKSSDGTQTKTYLVKMKTAPSTDTSITSISITYNGTTLPGTISGQNVTFGSFAYDTATSYVINYTLANGASGSFTSGRTFNFASQQYTAVTDTQTLTVTAQDTSVTTAYSIKFERSACDDANISAIQFNDLSNHSLTSSYNSNSRTYTVTGLAYDQNAFYVYITLVNGQTATISLNANTTRLSNNTNVTVNFNSSSTASSTLTYTLVVTAADTVTTQTYNVTVTRDAADDNKTLDNVSVTSGGSELGTWNQSNQTYTVSTTLPYTAQSFTVRVSLGTNTTASYTINNQSVPSLTLSFNGQNSVTVTIVVKAQDTSTNTITFNVERAQADTNANITIQDATYDGNSFTFTTTGNSSTNSLNVPFRTQTVKFKVVPSSSTTIIKIYVGTTWVEYQNQEYTWTLTQTSVTPPTMQFRIYTQADIANGNGGYTTHTITLNRELPNDDHTLKNNTLVVTDLNGTPYTPTITNNEYKYTIPQSVAGNNYYLAAEPNQATSAIYYTTNSNNIGSTASMSPFTSGDTRNIGTVLYLVVYSEYGLISQTSAHRSVYVINVQFTDERSTDATINNITPSEGSIIFSQNTIDYSITVPFNITSISFIISLNSSSATLVSITSSTDSSRNGKQAYTDPNGNLAVSLTVGVNYVYIQAKAQNDSRGQVYKIAVTRSQGVTDDFIMGLTINGIDMTQLSSNAFTRYSNNYDVVLARTTSQANLVFNFSQYASYTISFGGSQINQGSNTIAAVSQRINLQSQGACYTVTITVTSQVNAASGGAPNTYTINIYNASQDYSVSNIALLTTDESQNQKDVNNQIFQFVSGQFTYPTFNVAYSVNSIFIKFTLADSFATIANDGLVSLNAGSSKTVTVTVKSEYATLNPNVTNQTQTYTFVFERDAADTTNTLHTLEVLINGVNQITNFVADAPNQGPFTISDVETTITSVTINATPTSTKSTVVGTGIKSLTYVQGNCVLHVMVYSEDYMANNSGTYYSDYEIIISQHQVVLDTNNDMQNIIFKDSTNSQNDPNGTPYMQFNQSVAPYSITIPAFMTSGTIEATPAVATSYIIFEYNGQTHRGLTLDLNSISVGTTLVKVTCHAQDTSGGTTYEITINRPAPNANAGMDDITINGDTIQIVQGRNYYPIYVTNGVTSISNPPSVNLPLADNSYIDSQPQFPFQLSVGSNQLVYVVKAEDGIHQTTYIFDVIRDDDTTLNDLTLTVQGDSTNLISFDGSSTINVADTLPYESSKLDLSGILNGAFANLTVTITVNGTRINFNTSSVNNKDALEALIDLVEGANTIQIDIEAKSGYTDSYTINVNRAMGSDDNFILTYVTEENESLTILQSKVEYTYRVGRDKQTFNPTVTYSLNTTVTLPQNIALIDGLNIFEIVVESQKGTPRTYKFKVYRAENKKDIRNIDALESANGVKITDLDGKQLNFNATGDPTYTLRVSYTVSNFFLEVVTDGFYGKPFLNGNLYTTNSLQQLHVGENVFTIYVLSEYGYLYNGAVGEQSTVYTIKITREAADSNNLLSDLKVLTSSGDDLLQSTHASMQFDPAHNEYKISDVGDITSVNIRAIAQSQTSIVGGATGVQSLPALSTSTGNITGYVFTFTITVTAEDPSVPVNTYTVIIARGPIDLNQDRGLSYISVIDSNNKTYLSKDNFDPTTNDPITIQIPFNVQSYTITIIKSTPVSPATPHGTGQFTIAKADYGTTKTHDVYLTSQDPDDNGNTESKHYTIKVEISKPSNDAKLKDILINGVTISGFDPDGFTYDYGTLSNQTTSIDVRAVANDSKSKVEITCPNPLVVGKNTVIIVVTAEDGETKEIYTISVTRDYPLPYLTNLEGIGEALLNESDKNTSFNKDVFTYHFVVTFLKASITLNATVDNGSHSVVCSNSNFLADQSSSFTRVFVLSLNEGVNYFTITVTSIEGKTQSYNIVVQRRGLSSTNTNVDISHDVSIDNLPQFGKDYNNLLTSYGEYTVDYSVTTIGNVNLTLENGAARYDVFNSTLKVGANRVIILITAEDGETTRAIIINVIRKEMELTINEDAYEDFKPSLTDKDNVYQINLGDKLAKDIKDYTKFIDMKEEDREASVVEVLSDTSRKDCSEVVVRISDINGSTSKTITFQLSFNETNPGVATVSIFLWIALAVVIILLIIIIICVNKDKYGNILMKRKKMKN